jgi:hypothetical protein
VGDRGRAKLSQKCFLDALFTSFTGKGVIHKIWQKSLFFPKPIFSDS